jgi:hypothetical protein
MTMAFRLKIKSVTSLSWQVYTKVMETMATIIPMLKDLQ